MLSLLSITLKNVGSYKEQTHYFNNGGLKVIFGINRDTMPIDLKALSIDELFSKSDVVEYSGDELLFGMRIPDSPNTRRLRMIP